jgi:quinol monooxygenase YgiN
MVQLAVRVTVGKASSRALVLAFNSVLHRSRVKTGCLDARLDIDANDPDVLWYVEEWESLGEFEAHLRSTQFTPLLGLIEMSATQPLLECRLVSESRGIEYVASVRDVDVHDLALNGRPAPGQPNHGA